MGGPYYVQDGSPCKPEESVTSRCNTHEQYLYQCERERDYLRNIDELLGMLDRAISPNEDWKAHLESIRTKYVNTVFP